jgi:mRNA interferase MazF
MKRGEMYRVVRASANDPREGRVYVIVSRQALIEATRYSTVICAPVYSIYSGLSTQVRVGQQDGLKQDSSIHCDALVSIEKSKLAHYVGTLAADKMAELDQALTIALGLG